MLALLVVDAGIDEDPVAGARGVDRALDGAVVRSGGGSYRRARGRAAVTYEQYARALIRRL
jgi:hypothetical protein